MSLLISRQVVRYRSGRCRLCGEHAVEAREFRTLAYDGKPDAEGAPRSADRVIEDMKFEAETWARSGPICLECKRNLKSRRRPKP